MKIKYNDKKEIIKQWDNDPCGIIKDTNNFNKEYFTNIENRRYINYAPWLKKAVGFDKYKNKKILEIGFGQGTDLINFAKHGAEVYGVDLTPSHYSITSQRFQLYNKHATLKLKDAGDLSDFKNNTFDLIYSMGVIHHDKHPEKIISEMYRILKSNGKITIIVYNKNSIFFYFSTVFNYIFKLKFIKYTFEEWKSFIESRSTKNSARPYVKAYTKKELQELFKKFKIQEISTYHLEKSHFGLFRFFLFFIPKFKNLNKTKFGWYLVLKGKK